MSLAIELLEELGMNAIDESSVLQKDIRTLQTLFKAGKENLSHPAIVRSYPRIMDFADERKAIKRLEKQTRQNLEVKPEWNDHLYMMMRNIRQGAYDNEAMELFGAGGVVQTIFTAFKKLAA